MRQQHQRQQEALAQLERHRAALHAIPGVVGTGIGLGSDNPAPDAVVIQVFVRSSDQLKAVRQRVSDILGASEAEILVTGEVTAAGE